jgi:hypothetical protein
MPSDEGVGLDHAEGTAPLEQPAQSGHHEPHRVGCSVWLHFTLPEQRELFEEEKILGGQSGARPEA